MVMEMRRWWERVREISWATDRDDLASKMSATKSLRALKRFPGETYDWSTIIDKHATIVSPQKKDNCSHQTVCWVFVGSKCL
jgi:hypothetical protein